MCVSHGTSGVMYPLTIFPSPLNASRAVRLGKKRKVENLAGVFVNGIDCGVVWTAPYRVDISKTVKEGENSIRIEVVNTWNNRLIGDSRLPKEKRITNTMYPFKMEGKPLLPASLLGPVTIKATSK